jgi:hypothetical protein
LPDFSIRLDLAPHQFSRSLKDLERSFPNIRRDLEALFNRLESIGPRPNRSIGQGVYKERCPSSDMRKGQSGAFRVLILRRRIDLIPLIIYAKADREDITPEEIQGLVRSLQG